MKHPEQTTMLDALTCDPMELIARAGDVLDDRARWPQRLAELFDIEYAFALKSGMPADKAAADAAARTILIADYLGGSPIYLPRGDALRHAVHESEIYRRHRGDNHEALARELGMTSTNLYALIARERARRVRKLQGRLFDE